MKKWLTRRQKQVSVLQICEKVLFKPIINFKLIGFDFAFQFFFSLGGDFRDDFLYVKHLNTRKKLANENNQKLKVACSLFVSVAIRRYVHNFILLYGGWKLTKYVNSNEYCHRNTCFPSTCVAFLLKITLILLRIQSRQLETRVPDVEATEITINT